MKIRKSKWKKLKKEWLTLKKQFKASQLIQTKQNG